MWQFTVSFTPDQSARNKKKTVQQEFPTAEIKTLILTPPKARGLDLYETQLRATLP